MKKTFENYYFDPQNPKREVPLKESSLVQKEVALKLYHQMMRLRKVEEALIAEYHPADEMRCPVHFCVGQESVPAALSLILKKDDYLYSHHRTHGYYFAKGAPLKALFAEIYGKETGADGGKAGSQDISYAQERFFAGAILAGGLPLAAGSAMAIQNQKLPLVAVSGFGEGATDEGVVWETINYAALKKLPLVLVCENNRYATFSPQDKRASTLNIAERFSSFGVESRAIFGNDVVAAYETLNEAFEYARSGRGPFFVEAFTMRWNGHVGPENDDHQNYRSKEELDWWKAHCPIVLLERRLMASGVLTEAIKKEYVAQIEREIADCFAFAKSSAFPQIKTAEEYRQCNWSGRSPVADKLLEDQTHSEFDESQAELIPAPY